MLSTIKSPCSIEKNMNMNKCYAFSRINLMQEYLKPDSDEITESDL